MKKLLCLPIVLLLVILYYPKRTLAIVLFVAAGIMGVRALLGNARESGRAEVRKAVTGQISAIRVDQLKGFQEKAAQGVKNIECGGIE